MKIKSILGIIVLSAILATSFAGCTYNTYYYSEPESPINAE